MCEELKHIPQGLDTALLETGGEKALALQTLGSVALISLKADGSVGNSYLTPGKYQTNASITRCFLSSASLYRSQHQWLSCRLTPRDQQQND